jgi:hypothetical protein
MKKTIKSISLVLLGAGLLVSASACSQLSRQLDVVGKESVTSFATLLNTIPERVKADERNAGWALSAPDDAARFIWSADYSQSPLHDIMLELDAQPFLEAGLDPEQLPENYAFYEGDPMEGKMLMVGAKLGEKAKVSGTSTALSAYELIVNQYRDTINYHTSLDHYGVKLGDGNMFEWAKDLQTNRYDNSVQDKDMVFVLNPEPLIAAGVDPEKVEGWAYAQVPIEENGKTSTVWKLLKPFDLN